MTNSPEWQMARKLLRQQPFAVLGTSRGGHSYASLVAFATTVDACCLYFATTRATRKYHNLTQDDRVSLLIDNRADQGMALYEAAALTAYGVAKEIGAEDGGTIEGLYLARHPQLKAFIHAPTTAMFCIKVESYHLVQRFQNVTEFRMSECTT
jgi:hypothetical protein